jgi:pSer/pThr/pTyr-binding forkhead associated (FHA) protein
VVIGRGEHAGWIVIDPDLSRAHAAIDHRAGGAWLIDLGSKNGTRVDGVAAPTDEPGLALRDGAVITLGKTTIRFRDPSAAQGGAETRTSADRPDAGAAAVPPRWPIVAAALVAVVAIAVVIVLVAGG